MSVEAARNQIDRYGHFPLAMTFSSNDTVGNMADTSKPAYSAAFDAQVDIKRHAACDECRTIEYSTTPLIMSDSTQGNAN